MIQNKGILFRFGYKATLVTGQYSNKKICVQENFCPVRENANFQLL